MQDTPAPPDRPPPAAEGFEILRLLRALAPQAHLVALSAYNAEISRDVAANAGAAVCLSTGMLDSKIQASISPWLAPLPMQGFA